MIWKLFEHLLNRVTQMGDLEKKKIGALYYSLLTIELRAEDLGHFPFIKTGEELS